MPTCRLRNGTNRTSQWWGVGRLAILKWSPSAGSSGIRRRCACCLVWECTTGKRLKKKKEQASWIPLYTLPFRYDVRDFQRDEKRLTLTETASSETRLMVVLKFSNCCGRKFPKLWMKMFRWNINCCEILKNSRILLVLNMINTWYWKASSICLHGLNGAS